MLAKAITYGLQVPRDIMIENEKAGADTRQDMGCLIEDAAARLLREIDLIIDQLDRGGEHIAAAHVQMARDLLVARDSLESGRGD